jgi:hypothetical protein
LFLTVLSLAVVLSAAQQTPPTVEAGAARPTAATETPAGSTPPTTPGATAAAANERQVCTSTPVTGSRFPIRRCRSVAQAEAEQNESRDQLRQAQGTRLPPSGN